MALKNPAAWLCLLALGCLQQPSRDVDATPLSRIEDPAQRGDLPRVMILMPLVEESARLRRAIVSEVQESFDVQTLRTEDVDAPRLGAQLRQYHPDALVLIDNRSVALYRQVQAEAPAEAAFPPALVLMSSFAEKVRSTLRNAAAIGFEVPAVTAVATLRRLVHDPIRRVGVVYRRMFQDFVDHNRALSHVENVEIVGMPVGASPSANELGQALHQLLAGDKPVDALWVLNDNGLLSAQLMREIWLPMVHEFRPPVLVGVEALVNRELDFGSLAVLPDIDALGLQAAQHLLGLADHGFRVETQLEPPISICTVLDAAQARQFFSLREDAVSGVDRVVR